MGYSVWFDRNGSSGEVKRIPRKDLPVGSIIELSEDPTAGEEDLKLTITFNYSRYFRYALASEDGLKSLFGKTVKEIEPQLKRASMLLNELAEKERKTGKLFDSDSPYDPSRVDDYWYGCAENARQAIRGLLVLCDMAPKDFRFCGSC